MKPDFPPRNAGSSASADPEVGRLSLAELLAIARPGGPIGRAVRNAQLDALVRLVPAILAGQLAAGTVLVLSMLDSVPPGPLLGW